MKRRWKNSWFPAFLLFVSKVKVPSKEMTEPGPITLYGAQERFLIELDEALANGKHFVVCLKARQLGMSTLLLLLDIFWCYIHPGLQGALIADTSDNKDTFRQTITQMLDSLPPGFRVPIKSHNRTALTFQNGSRIQYMQAGVGKNSGLGRSRAFSFVHGSEIGRWGDQKGIDTLLAALATKNPNRLYIWESTALGYNAFYDMYKGALTDPKQHACFIGWWAKELYRIESEDPEFDKWWGENPTLSEIEQAMEVLILADYGHQMLPEQWAWWRKMQSTRSEGSLMEEFPWHAQVAFQATGSPFFARQRLNEDLKFLRGSSTFNGYRYVFGNTLASLKCEPVMVGQDAELRVWEKPQRLGRYVMGIDVAYGRSDTADRHSISVWRCYADKMVQVAEWGTSLPETRQVAWVLAHLAGSYRDVMINLEISGPGIQVMNEMKHLRQQMTLSQVRPDLPAGFDPRGALDQARWFIYHRPESPGSGYIANWRCLALDTKLPTPTGWTTMGALKPGDFLLNEKGEPTKVLGKSPVKIGLKCYRVTFDDGTQITADEDHLWLVWRNNWKGAQKIRTTAQLLVGKHAVQRAAALCLPHAPLPVDPYVLGVWLGDGSSQAPLIHAHPADMPTISHQLELCGMRLGPIGDGKTAAYRTMLGVKPIFSKLGLLQNKHIPEIYLRASHNQRLALLQGLMDTDGSVSASQGQCSFTTTNEKLRDGFAELLRTLGIKAKYCVRDRMMNYRGGQRQCATAYQFWFTTELPAFRMARKLSVQGQKQINRLLNHRILQIEQVASVPVQCIKVSSESSLFLAGDGMIPTHNTNFDNKQDMMNGLRDAYNTEGLIVRSVLLLEEMMTLVQNGSAIQASGRNKDDRPIAAALARYAWQQWVRPSMMEEGRTYAKEHARETVEIGMGTNVVGGIIPQFFAEAAKARSEAEIRRYLEEL